MLSAFLIALREGVEAALVVGIILVYLSRTGRSHLARYVWGGVAAAVALSLARSNRFGAFQISEDGFEGLLLLVASFFVVTMIIWMNRIARHLKKEIEEKVEILCRAVRCGRGMGHRPIRFPDGGARRSGTGADSARGRDVHGRIADLDRHGGWHCRGSGRGSVLFQRHAEDSVAPFFRGHQRDPDSSGDSAGGYGLARIERGALAALQPGGDVVPRARSCATNCFSSFLCLAPRR